MGPILKFGGFSELQWHTSALFVIPDHIDKPKLTVREENRNPQEVAAVELDRLHAQRVLRYDWAVQLSAEARPVNFHMADESYTYQVPADSLALRIAYGSCFGTDRPKKTDNRLRMWEVLQQDHQKQPYHLMLMGGDQLYADGVWDEVPSLKEWQELPAKEKLRMPFSPRMAHEVSLFYLKLYMHRWSQSPAAQMMSSIPCLMMWDDHDIFDGWGSWPENQVGAVHTGVYQVARKYFRLFQLQSAEGEKKAQFLNPDQNFSFAYRLGRSAIVAPDMRSERKPRQVMSRHSWKKLFAWMYKQAGNSNGQTEDCRHILLMSAIPIIYVNARYIERLLNWIPGQQPMEDDFRDQWLSHAHREERHWVVREFFGFVRETGCRITLLSGDVHVGCAGKLTYTHQNTGESYVIDQLVSSAMVNFPPPAPMVYAMDKLAAVQENRIDENISARLVSLPGSRKRILGCRNYLSLQLDEQDRLQVNWQADSENKPCTLTIESLRHKTFLESLS